MIQEAYVNFEIAKLLKEKGFDVPCCNCYGDNQIINNYLVPRIWNKEEDLLSAPTYQMVLAWLRAQGIHIDIITSFDLNGKDHYSYTIYQNNKLIRCCFK